MKPSRLRELVLGGALASCWLASCRQLVGIEDRDDASPAVAGFSAGSSGEASVGGSDDSVDGNLGGSAASRTWVDVTANLTDVFADCGDVTLLASKPDEDLLIAGLRSKGLWMSRDGGESWGALGAEGEPIVHIPTSIVFDPDDANRFWETGVDGAGVHRTVDGGRAFTPLGELFHVFTLGVDFTDPARKILLAGGYEQSAQISRDGGASWRLLSQALPDNCSVPLILDSQTYLVGCNAGDTGGIYRSSDAGDHWSKVSEARVRGAPLLASDQRIYWGSDAESYAGSDWQPWVEVLLRSDDGGKSWLELAVPRSAQSPLDLPNGWLAWISGGVVVVSRDHGAKWRAVTPTVPHVSGGMLTYSPFQRAFFVAQMGCEAENLAGPRASILRYDYLAE